MSNINMDSRRSISIRNRLQKHSDEVFIGPKNIAPKNSNLKKILKIRKVPLRILPLRDCLQTFKVGCFFLTVVSILAHAEFGPNHH